jgi:hypothetical protein
LCTERAVLRALAGPLSAWKDAQVEEPAVARPVLLLMAEQLAEPFQAQG